MKLLCPTCEGVGKILSPDNHDTEIPCPTCKGKRYIRSRTIPGGYVHTVRNVQIMKDNEGDHTGTGKINL